jgi:hypothetical protein
MMGGSSGFLVLPKTRLAESSPPAVERNYVESEQQLSLFWFLLLCSLFCVFTPRNKKRNRNHKRALGTQVHLSNGTKVRNCLLNYCKYIYMYL